MDWEKSPGRGSSIKKDAGVPNLPETSAVEPSPPFIERSSLDGTSGSVPSTPPRSGGSKRLRLGGKRPGAEVHLKE